jgi:C-terminal, D2-small domain, of ClpB protein
VVFKALTTEELRRVLDIEIEAVHRMGKDVAKSARDFLLREGADLSYGARPLKRAIERFLLYPVSDLIAPGQVRRGDRIRVTAAREFRYPDVRALYGSAFLGDCPSRSVAGTASGYTARSAPAQKRSRRTRFSTLPEPLFGSSVSENSI